MSFAKVLLLALPFIANVKGICQRQESSKNDLQAVKCICWQQNQDLIIESGGSESFAKAHYLEINGCRNVTLLPGIFLQSTKLQIINISEVDYLFLSSDLSLPSSLKYLYFSKVGFLDGWLAPEPNAALLNSLNSLQELHLRNITVAAPLVSVSSTFYDLPIREVTMIGVHFIGALPQGALEFNPSTLTAFNAIGCHFGDLYNNSLYIKSSESVNFADCTFGKVASGAVYVSGADVAFVRNSFLHLDDKNSAVISATSKFMFSVNLISNLGGPNALELRIDNKALIDINDNQLPCNHYDMIWKWYRKFRNFNCYESVCIPLKNNFCTHANGQKEIFYLQTNETFSLLQFKASQGSISRVRPWLYFCIFLLYFIWFDSIHDM